MLMTLQVTSLAQASLLHSRSCLLYSSTWMSQKFLKLNMSKTEFIVFLIKTGSLPPSPSSMTGTTVTLHKQEPMRCPHPSLFTFQIQHNTVLPI